MTRIPDFTRIDLPGIDLPDGNPAGGTAIAGDA